MSDEDEVERVARELRELYRGHKVIGVTISNEWRAVARFVLERERAVIRTYGWCDVSDDACAEHLPTCRVHARIAAIDRALKGSADES